MATPRQLTLTTPLGPDVFLVTLMNGSEGISRLFRFQLELVAENKTDIAFDKLLGQSVTIHLTLPKGKTRHWNGIVSRISQGERDEELTSYHLEIVPLFWLWSRRIQSRVFQHKNVPEILKEVLAGLDVKYEIQGTFHPRNYCTQYAESDFAFASRLMEEEGIFYYFKHLDGAHQLMVANAPSSHAEAPEYPKAIYEKVIGGNHEDDRVWAWRKTQELCSGKYTLWDHTFELPGKNLAAETIITDSVAVGKVTHKLKVANNDKLETYVFPGGYAHRFDGIDRSGGERPADLEKIFEDNLRTCKLRMEAEAVGSFKIDGASACRQFTSGHKFTLERHFNADGQYVLTTVEHDAKLLGDLHLPTQQTLQYENHFTCIPAALPFRPAMDTPRPAMKGTQTATVVGPPGEEIHCDKYGRVKVQFHWDRLGQFDADSSCWVRVSYSTAGKGFGLVVVPRVGQEVVVDFEGGDPDEPVVIGTVFNSDNMPPTALPGDKATMTLRSNTYPGGGGHNEMCFKDNAGEQQFRMQAEKDMLIKVKNDVLEEIDQHVKKTIGASCKLEVKENHDETVRMDKSSTVGGSEVKDIAMNLMQNIGANQIKNVMATATENVGMVKTIVVGAVSSLKGAASVLGGTPSGAGQFITNIYGIMLVDVSRDMAETIDGEKRCTVGTGFTLTVKKKDFQTIVATNDYDIQVQEKNYNLNVPSGLCNIAAKKVQISAAESLTLKCGAADDSATISMVPKKIQIMFGENLHVTITKEGNDAGISIKGQEVKVRSTTGVVSIKAEKDLNMEGENYTLFTEGTGKLTSSDTVEIEGAVMVKINC